MAENFYFAWVNDGVAFNPAVHNVMDEDIFSFKLSQTEGDFASLELVIKNPRIGLLHAGRKVWAWFSMNTGTDVTPVLKPLFFGRLIAIPDNMFDTLVTLTFTARPSDFVSQKNALAATLRVAPYYDPIFISPDKWEDPDVVLETRSALWHVDPVTHVVSVSDVILPEDGTIEFTESTVFYDGVAVSLQTVPLRAVDVTATIPWTQEASGDINLNYILLQRFPGGGGIGGLISSFTFNGLSSSWPKAGARIGDGWQVTSGALEDQSFLAVKPILLPDYFDPNNIPQAIPEGSIVFQPKISGRIWGGVDGAGFDTTVQQVVVPIGYGVPELSVTYAAKREFAQVVHFTMFTDMQDLVTLATEDEAMIINLTANKVSDTTRDGTMPLRDARRRGFVHLPRGRQAIEHLVLLARANLIIRSRAVKVTFQCGLLDGINVTLRKGALLHDHRLPGGQAEGKITSYTLELDGSNGTALATVEIGCAVGRGGAYTSAAGNSTWADSSWVGSDWQEYTNVVTLLGTSDLTYSLPVQDYFDDGVDFQAGLSDSKAVKSLTVTNDADTQRAVLLAAVPDIGDQAAASTALHTVPTQYHLQLLPLGGGPFTGVVEVGVADLIVPKQIDLEAASV